MAVKLVPRAQVVVAQEGRRPGPVNALAFKRSEVSIARRRESETEKIEKERPKSETEKTELVSPKRKTPRTRHNERSSRGNRSPSVSPAVALTDEDSESSSRPMRQSGTQAGRRSALRCPGTTHVGRKRRPDGRRPPRVSRRVRQLQAQHEDELWRKRTQKKIEMEKIEKRKREEREERQEVHQKSQDFKSVQEALPSKGPQQSSLPELFEHGVGLNEERASRVQRDPEKQRAPPRPSKAKHVARQLKPSGEVVPMTEDKAPAVAAVPLGAKPIPQTRAAPALALRRWRQARKRQNLLGQITAMRGEMKFERRQLLSALKRPFNISSLQAEVQQKNRELKVRFQKFYAQMSLERQERQKSRTVLKVLAAEHTELQRAFVRLMNECGFARPSALKMSSPKTEPAGNTRDDQDDQNGQNGQEEDDDDVIVEGDIEENQVQEQNESDREKLKKEMQGEALRAELLLRALDAEGSV